VNEPGSADGARAETSYSAEHDVDSKDHGDELDRTVDDAKARDDQRVTKILADVIASQAKLTAEITNSWAR
jgi:hypothetical protein